MASNITEIKAETAFLDVSQLTEQAKQELVDFYQFLLERYGVNQRSPKTLPDIFYHPVKTRTYQQFNRDAIYDGR
jgi:hypothetical protein